MTDTGASFAGPSFGQDSAEVSITLDCAPRDAVDRGFTGRVHGMIDGRTLDAPLFCGAWENADTIAARTDEGGSIGIGSMTDAATCPDDLLRAADQALYAAKAGGRNRWAIRSVDQIRATG